MVQTQQPRRSELEYQWLEDFTSGIFDRVSYGNVATGGTAVFTNQQQPAPVGAAQVANTYGCYGMIGGGLAPGPRVVQLTPATSIPMAAGTNSGDIYSGGLIAVGPIVPHEAANITDWAPYKFEALLFGWNFVLNNAGTWTYNSELKVYKGWDQASLPRTQVNSSISGGASTNIGVGGMFFADTQSIPSAASDATVPGLALVAMAGGVIVMGGTSDGLQGTAAVYFFPDIDTTSGATDTFNTTGGFFLPVLLVAHQGRIVGAESGVFASGFDHWSADGTSVGNVALAYCTVNDVFGSQTELVIPDLGLDGITSMFSVNASELFCVRGRGGALSIRGDLDNPTIVRYPGVMGTGGIPNVGCNTPFGYVYGSRHGIYAWSGGDQSDHLSPQMSGPFWISNISTDRLERRLTNAGSFAYSEPFIFAPNNYMFDTRTKSWWRYAPIGGDATEMSGATQYNSAFLFHSTGPYSGDVYAMWGAIPYTTGSFQPGVRICKNEWARTYSYQSQPLSWSIRRQVNIRDVVAYIQGIGTVTITMKTAAGVSKAISFVVNSPDAPVPFVSNSFDFIGTDMTITIASTSVGNGPGATCPAPVVWRVGFGLIGRQSIAGT